MMSCNGCRVLRKGCSDECMLRHCLLWIENSQAHAHATIFVAKFFGRAALMSFISSVPANQRSGALFQSLLYEAVGRTINPVNGVVGLLWSGNWNLCQLSVEKVLRGGSPLIPLPLPHQVHLGTDHVDCSSHQVIMSSGSRRMLKLNNRKVDKRVIMVSHQASQEESETTTLGSSSCPHDCPSQTERKLLTLFF